jgi:ABC-2 type transport system ATP-binding protein
LFLDEPTVGLDVVSKERVREFLADLNARHNTTVLLTTHDLDDIERLCNRLLIIDHGHVIYDGGLDALRDKYGQERTLVVDLAETSAPITIAAAEVVKVDGPRQWLRFRRESATAADLIAEIAERYPLRDLTLEEPAIEDIVRRIYVEGI